MLFLALLLGRDRQGRGQVLLFAPLALCLSGFVAGNTPDAGLRLSGPAGAFAHLVSGYAAVFIWWFCLACFDRGFRLGGWVLAVGLAWIGLASLDRGLFGPALADKGLSWVLVAFGFFMVGHLAWRLLRDREGDLVESRRGARLATVLLLGGMLLTDLLVDLIMGFEWRPRWFASGQNTAVLIFTLWLASRLVRADPAPLSFASAPPMPAPQAAPNPLAERLRRLIEVERVHLDPELNLADLVRRMGAPERAVRQLINHELGYDHFRAFLNACRMEEARRLLADPTRAGDKLIAIALDSGFASLASFNRVFRASEGRTPSDYRAARLGDAPAAPGFEKPLAAF
jgi:AraC-like DNA-binding protein